MDTCGRYRTAIKFFPPATFIPNSVQIVRCSVVRRLRFSSSEFWPPSFPLSFSRETSDDPFDIDPNQHCNTRNPRLRTGSYTRRSYIVYFVLSRHIFFVFANRTNVLTSRTGVHGCIIIIWCIENVVRPIRHHSCIVIYLFFYRNYRKNRYATI